MADDFDVEAMLEAPYRKEDDGIYSSGRDKDKDRDKDRRKRSRSRDRKKDKSDKDRGRDRRDRDRDRDRGDRDRGDKKDRGDRHRDRGDRDRIREIEREKKREQERNRERDRRSRSRERRKRRSPTPPPRPPATELTPEERDARTVFCMQLSARIRPRDLEEFFSSVGKVTDVRIIMDNKTRRSKGISYVEFADVDSVPLAMGLAGQRLLGVPIIVQASQAEKNRAASAAAATEVGDIGPMRLYVGSLHFNITEEMLRGIFEPFGKIEDIKLIKNSETSRSQGFGFITFSNAGEAKKALEQLNGFELAGRPMKVGHVTERTGENQGGASMLDSDEIDRTGIGLGATGRLQLMAKLAEGTGFQIPQVATNALNMAPNNIASPPLAAQSAPPIATQCFMLANMFDPASETNPTWDQEIRDDVIEECNKHGGVLHIYVDKASPQGNVYVKCPSIAAAVASVQALHGRWFAGKVITAAYVPLPNYHQLFAESLRATQLLMTSAQQALSNGLAMQGGFGLM